MKAIAERKEIKWWEEPSLEKKQAVAKQEVLLDSLAENYATKEKNIHWGRWYLGVGKCLSTAIFMDDGLRYGAYDIPLDRINEDWLSHMLFTKNWLGVSGLHNLAEALYELRHNTKEGKIK